MRLFRFQPSRGGHLLPHVRHREADPQVPGRPHGQHARVAEREEDRGHPGSVSTITRETWYKTVKFAFLVDALRKDYTYINDFYRRCTPISPNKFDNYLFTAFYSPNTRLDKNSIHEFSGVKNRLYAYL